MPKNITEQQEKKEVKQAQPAAPVQSSPEKTAPASGPQSPSVTHEGNQSAPQATGSPDQSSSYQRSGEKKTRYKGKGIGPNGQPRNFYNPPSKVMRQLAQQSYYDNFYGNQAKFYTLR